MAVKEQAKHTPGPWTLELVQTFPFGIKVTAGEKVIIEEAAYCHSSKQETREDCENGFGFSYRSKFCTPEQAQAFIAEQDANARLIAASPETLEALKSMVEFYEDADHDEEAKAFPTENCPICRAKAVIAKAEGR